MTFDLYDPENHLTSYTSGGTLLLSADYRGDGLRAYKETATSPTYFFYDGETPIYEMSITRTGPGTAWNSSSGPIISYVSAVNLFGPDGLYERDFSTDGINLSPVTYLLDPFGNAVARTTDVGTGSIPSPGVFGEQLYDAWGLLTDGTPYSDDPWGYRAGYGYYTDQETGLILCTHRYYDPVAGRWVTENPAGEEGGANVYEYCGGNPMEGIDPEGLTDDYQKAKLPTNLKYRNPNTPAGNCFHAFFYCTNHKGDNEGYVGYGETGIKWGYCNKNGDANWNPNLGAMDPHAINCNLTDAQEDELWAICKSLDAGNKRGDNTCMMEGQLWKASQGTFKWYGDETLGEFNLY